MASIFQLSFNEERFKIYIVETLVKEDENNNIFTQYLIQTEYKQKRFMSNHMYKSFENFCKQISETFSSFNLPQCLGLSIDEYDQSVKHNLDRGSFIQNRGKILQSYLRLLENFQEIRNHQIFKQFLNITNDESLQIFKSLGGAEITPIKPDVDSIGEYHNDDYQQTAKNYISSIYQKNSIGVVSNLNNQFQKENRIQDYFQNLYQQKLQNCKHLLKNKKQRPVQPVSPVKNKINPEISFQKLNIDQSRLKKNYLATQDINSSIEKSLIDHTLIEQQNQKLRNYINECLNIQASFTKIQNQNNN